MTEDEKWQATEALCKQHDLCVGKCPNGAAYVGAVGCKWQEAMFTFEEGDDPRGAALQAVQRAVQGLGHWSSIPEA